jgi:cytochrome b6-f complex iron-sulfur subunit
MANHSRRKFIKTISGSTAALCCGSIGMGFLMQGCTSIKQIEARVINNKVTVNKTEFEEENFLVLNNPKFRTPIYLNKVNEENYIALLMLCTHKDCDVKPTGTYLTCPCHGSQFSNKGQVLNGPATENLTGFQTITNESSITIDLNQPIRS